MYYRDYQLKSSWFQSIYLSRFHWFATYCLIVSISIPTVETKYHLLQKLFWLIIFIFPWLLWRMIALLPFNLPRMSATEYFGAIRTIMWIWSGQTLPLMISKPNLRESSRKSIQISLRIPWKRIDFLYFGYYHYVVCTIPQDMRLCFLIWSFHRIGALCPFLCLLAILKYTHVRLKR